MLAFLCPAAKEDNDCLSVRPEVDPASGAEINPPFIHAATDALGIREITLLDSNQRGCDLGRCRGVEAFELLRKPAAAARIKVPPDRDHKQW